MSRYRDDRDDEYFGGRMRDREFEERYERERQRADSGPNERPGRYDEGAPPPPPRRDARGGERAYEDYYREREYRPRDYGTGASSAGRGGGERDEYERGRRYEEEFRRPAAGYDDRRPPAHDERPREERGGEREGRSLWEEGREYFSRRRRGGVTARSHLRCRDIMTRDVTVATRDATLEMVARMMRDEDTGVIPVVDRDGGGGGAPVHADANAVTTDDHPAPAAPAHSSPAPDTTAGEGVETRRAGASVHGNGRLVGLITDRDIAVRAVAEGRDTRVTRAEEIMTTDVHVAHPNDRVIEAIRKMGDKQVRRIPIVDRDGVLRGIISMADVALETDDDRELAEALEEISSGSSFWSKIFG